MFFFEHTRFLSFRFVNTLCKNFRIKPKYPIIRIFLNQPYVKYLVNQAYLIIGFGSAIVILVILALAVCVKLYCCQDKRKFRSSKETKCVRHQQCMTSPLDSPARSIISGGPRAVAVEAKEGPLPIGPIRAQSTNSLQRVQSSQSVNEEPSCRELNSSVIVPK